MSSCPAAFSKFIENISLGSTQVGRIDSAVRGLNSHLTSYFPNLTSEIPFLQGSFPNGTAVRPVSGGEYDVDLVVRTASDNDSPDEALQALQTALSDHGRYDDRIVPKKPCVRLEYANEGDIKFHVDFVPVRIGQTDAPLDAPRRGETWHGTAPREFTEWCRLQGSEFARTVKMLKRWRDEQQDVRSAVKSIIFQVLISKAMPAGVADDATRLTQTLINLRLFVTSNAGVPEVINPTLPSENLARRWSIDHFNSFRQHIVAASEAAERALAESDQTEAQLLWADLFGEGFPTPDSKSVDIELADTSHKHPVSSKGWIEQIDHRYAVTVSARVVDQRGKTVFPSYPSDGSLIMDGWQVGYKAHVTAPDSNYTVWWQVVNTGGHARDERTLRGEFLQGKKKGGGPSPDQTVNWESTAYTGKHWVEAFVVTPEGIVVARSGPFYINVFNRKRKQFWR